ncbi:MAG TPA: TlyA family RNA methyltransferase [Polyangiaceae bacterium]|nr:TlyA family RNA methyltransferase [Polyangiaceae bacterium]
MTTSRDRPAGPKVRADLLLLEQGHATSRAHAQALILAGDVFVGDDRVEKPGQLLRRETPLRVRERERYVSRGGYKLEGALDGFALDPAGMVCVDVGASTGGFTDCLLQRGARRVYAVDVGENQLAPKLREDPRVVVRDRTNARYLDASAFDEPIDLVVVDASFIGIDKLLPALARIVRPGALLLALVKPQFEAGRREVSRGKGVIRDPEVRERVLAAARSAIEAHGFTVLGAADSVLGGPKGNREHFVFARRT